MAVERVLGSEMVWYSEIDKHANMLLEQRFPAVRNIGDLTLNNWEDVPPVEILTGGYPCQPFSTAGKRKGEDDPRHLWPYIREGIRALRPTLTILENVAGHRSKGFATVLRDCAEDGLAVRWVSVRASDAGAPHRRERLFFVVTDADCFPGSERYKREVQPRIEASLRGNTPGRGIPATDATDIRFSGIGQAWGRGTGPSYNAVAVDWDKYEAAIQRWEHLTRPAPAPTEPNRNGNPRLTPAFVEWMMGLPGGWVSDCRIPYGAKLKLLGNGVVPQQAELALGLLLDIEQKDL